MPLTPASSPQVESRPAATIDLRTVAVRTLSGTRTNVDGPISRQAGKRRSTGPSIDIVEIWGIQSFPASDPPTNW